MEPENFEGFIIRFADEADINESLIRLHTSLAQPRVQEILRSQLANKLEFVHIVAQHSETLEIMALASGFIEQKFIREGGKVFHMQKIILADPTNKKLFAKLVSWFMDSASRAGCYKIIGPSGENDTNDFKDLGFNVKDLHMEEEFS